MAYKFYSSDREFLDLMSTVEGTHKYNKMIASNQDRVCGKRRNTHQESKIQETRSFIAPRKESKKKKRFNLLRKHLKEFWYSVGKGENRLYLLKYYSRQVIHERRGAKLAEERARFNITRRLGKSRCFICDSDAYINHHVLALKNGGHNGWDNLVKLCEGCHAEIHEWLGSKDRLIQNNKELDMEFANALN